MSWPLATISSSVALVSVSLNLIDTLSQPNKHYLSITNRAYRHTSMLDIRVLSESRANNSLFIFAREGESNKLHANRDYWGSLVRGSVPFTPKIRQLEGWGFFEGLEHA